MPDSDSSIQYQRRESIPSDWEIIAETVSDISPSDLSPDQLQAVFDLAQQLDELKAIRSQRSVAVKALEQLENTDHPDPQTLSVAKQRIESLDIQTQSIYRDLRAAAATDPLHSLLPLCRAIYADREATRAAEKARLRRERLAAEQRKRSHASDLVQKNQPPATDHVKINYRYPPSDPAPDPKPAPPEQPVQKSSPIVNTRLVPITLAVILAVLASALMKSCGSSSVEPPETTARTPVTTAPALIAQAAPANGHIFERIGLKEFAPFSVTAPADSDVYVVMDPISFGEPENLELYSHQQLVNKVQNSELRFFVRAGCTVELDVPLGDYLVYYATGDTWYGQRDLFGPDTQYYKCEGTFDFNSDSLGYNGWTITLTAVVGGNLDTDPVDASVFPK